MAAQPAPKDYISIGRDVIAQEAEALRLLHDQIGAGFEAAVAAIIEAKGRVIVSGMGKSGHIARKIAATFASTGTPAHFVHPAEASHGDLGMITPGDIALVLSNSGETPELADLIAHCKRYKITLIGVASRPRSTLIEAADIAITLPAAKEACANGVVPTSSTTMTLALGDALAVALMESRHFTSEHFRAFHPGGKLGAALSRVEDLMHGTKAPQGKPLPLVLPETAMPDVLLTITKSGFGVAGVVDAASGALTGIITDGDLRRHMQGLLERSAGEVMTPNPVSVTPERLAAEALGIMNTRKITSLFVIAKETAEPVGIIHIHDCLRAGLG